MQINAINAIYLVKFFFILIKNRLYKIKDYLYLYKKRTSAIHPKGKFKIPQF